MRKNNSIRNAYNAVMGNASGIPIAEEEIEMLRKNPRLRARLSSPELRGKLAGQRDALRSDELRRYVKASEMARKSSSFPKLLANPTPAGA